MLEHQGFDPLMCKEQCFALKYIFPILLMSMVLKEKSSTHVCILERWPREFHLIEQGFYFLLNMGIALALALLAAGSLNTGG